MSISLKLKRNNTVAENKTTATEALTTELGKAQAGEPRIATYADDGDGVGILFGISAGDGSYAIFDNHFKTIDGETIVGDGNIDLRSVIDAIDAKVGSNDYSGAQYISKEENTTDALMQLDTEVKATNDNIAIGQEAIRQFSGNVTTLSGEVASISGSLGTYATKEELGDYLPLSGGTLTGMLKAPTLRGGDIIAIGGDILISNGNEGELAIQGNTTGYGTPGAVLNYNKLSFRQEISDDNTSSLSITDSGVTISGKTDNDLLNAAGGTYDISELETKVDDSLTDFYLNAYSDNDILWSASFTDNGTYGTRVRLSPASKTNSGQFNSTDFYINAPLVTSEANGVMSKEDKTKLDSIDTDTLATKTELDGYLRKDITELILGDNSNMLNSWITIRKPSDSSTCFTISHNGYYLNIDEKGISIVGKGSSHLLNAGGSTTPISDIVTQVQAAIVDSAPETLDTLNELAAALGDDPNFATTVTNQIAQKADKTTATTSADGLMSATDKAKLDAIEENANNYSLPLASASTRGGIKIGYSTTGRNYAVQLNNEQAFVNVPWTDQNVTQNAAISNNGSYNVLVGGSANTTAQTGAVNKAAGLTYNPSTKVLSTTTFQGALNGNAATATKATQDASGNVITTTYATKSEVASLQNTIDALTARIAALEAALTIQNV